MHFQKLFILKFNEFYCDRIQWWFVWHQFFPDNEVPCNGWIKDSFNVWNNILNYFFTFSKTLFGFFFKGHHLSVTLDFIFFCFPHLWYFLPLLSSGFYISFFLLPTPLFWAMLIHLFKECILNVIPCQVLFYHNPDNTPAFMVINFNKGGGSQATNTLFNLRSINSIKTNETGYRHREWQGISPERMVKKHLWDDDVQKSLNWEDICVSQ